MRKLVIVLMGMTLLMCLAGCGEAKQPEQNSADAQKTSTSQPQSNVNLSQQVDYNGVELKIDSSWKNELSGQYPSITPSSDSKITFYTFVNSETESFDNMDEYILSTPSNYTLENEWKIDGGTSVSSYTMKADSGSLYTVVIGYHADSGAGFLIFFNRGDNGEKSTLNDSVLTEIFASIAFDPASAKDDSIETAKESSKKEPSNDSEKSNTSVSISQQNALRSAKDYLDLMPFSYTGLIEQLEYEQYSTEDATYAADNCGADWNVQAEKAAEDYIDLMPFSRGELIDQLMYEGYTEEQAAHGADYVGL